MVLTEKKAFFSKLLKLALPMMIHQLLINSVSFVDTIMIGRLGAESVAAVGLANQMFFLISLLTFGLGSGASVLMSQFLGANKINSFKRSFILAIISSFAFSLLFFLSSFFFPTQIMSFFAEDKEVISLGVQYLKIVSFSYFFSTVGYIYATAFRTIHNTKLPLFVATFALSINTVGNYLLIFGIGPFPELGVEGAAISTAFSRLLEFSLLIGMSYRKKNKMLRITKHLNINFTKPFVKKFFFASSPIVLNELTWALGMVAYKYAFSKMGTSSIAAVQVTESITGLFFVVSMGLSAASSIMIGNKIGEKEYELAQLFAKRFVVIAFSFGFLMSIFLAISAPLLTSFFGLEKSISNLIIQSLYAFSLILPIKFLANVVIVGIIRGGGSTAFILIAETICVWLIGVPAVFISVFLLKLPLPTIYLITGIEEITKTLIGIFKIKSKTWIKDYT